jgi:hypothetical protein
LTTLFFYYASLLRIALLIVYDGELEVHLPILS